MEKGFTRRNFLKSGALGFAAMLLPTTAFAESRSESSNSLQAPQDPNPIFRASIEDIHGRKICEVTQAGTAESKLNNDFPLILKTECISRKDFRDACTSIYSAYIIDPTYAEKQEDNSGPKANDGLNETSDTSYGVVANVTIAITYYLANNKTQIKITKAEGSVHLTANYANILGNSMAVAQGPLGSQYLGGTFSGTSHTINTGWNYIPYINTNSSSGLVLNGGECVSEIYITGMGNTIIRAECVI